jgi:hypothetical protein
LRVPEQAQDKAEADASIASGTLNWHVQPNSWLTVFRDDFDEKAPSA